MIFRLLLFIFFFSFVWVSSIYSDVDNEREVLENLIGIADFYYEQKNLELSLNYYNFAIKLAFKLDDKKSLHFLFSRIGDIYYHIGNSLKALDSYYSAYSISIKAKNNKWIVGDIIRLAKLHLLTSQYKIANRYINKALEIAEKEKYRNDIVESLLVLANIQLFWGDYDKAVQIAERVLEIADNDMQLARAYIRLGKAWYYKGDYEKASLFLDNAKKLSSQKPVFFARNFNLIAVRVILNKISQDRNSILIVAFINCQLRSVNKLPGAPLFHGTKNPLKCGYCHNTIYSLKNLPNRH